MAIGDHNVSHPFTTPQISFDPDTVPTNTSSPSPHISFDLDTEPTNTTGPTPYISFVPTTVSENTTCPHISGTCMLITPCGDQTQLSHGTLSFLR